MAARGSEGPKKRMSIYDRSKSPKKMSAAYRDWHGNKRKSGAPFGRYEDLSAVPASHPSVKKAAIKRAGAEGPKKSSPVKKAAVKKTAAKKRG
jgi:hypothetical protein